MRVEDLNVETMNELTEGTPPPNQTQIKHFYIFDRDDTLIDDRGQLINPQFIVPFVATILHENTFAWAIASAGATELQVDPFYKAISAEMEIRKKPAYIQFNRINSLISSVINFNGVAIQWDPTEQDLPPETKARILFSMLLENKEPKPNQEIRWQRNTTTLTFTPEASLKFKFGNTTIVFKVTTLLNRINDLAKGDFKLFFIFLAMDKMGLRPELSQELLEFGVNEIQSPESYVTINPKNVVFVDDRKNNCDIIAEAGFTAITADTEAASQNRNYPTTNTYLSKMELTLPEPIKELFNVSKAFTSLSDHDLNTISYENIQSLRNSALNVIAEQKPNHQDVEQLWTLIQRFDISQLMKIFSHSKYSLLSKSIHSEEDVILKEIAEQYIGFGQYHKALSDFLISGLSHQWKSSDVQSQISQIAAIKPLGHGTISATHFRLVYQAQYQSEFFKNPRSTMRQAILKNGEKHFDENTNMVEIIDGNKNGSNRTSAVLKKLGA